jgi:GDP-D-mannose dehydratase
LGLVHVALRLEYRPDLDLDFLGLPVPVPRLSGQSVAATMRAFANHELDLLVGDATKAHQRLGWRPRVSFEQLVAMMVDADIAAVQAGW